MFTELIFEFAPPYACSSFACAYRTTETASENVNSYILSIDQMQQQPSTCRISSLNDEAFNISVEGATIVEPTGTQSKKILYNEWGGC